MGQTPLGLYVHIPFCAAICNYCNFNRGLFDANLKDSYLEALLVEIQGAPDSPGPGLPPDRRREVEVDTVFFGGGTPSLLTPEEVGTLLDACRTTFAISPDAEITLEANPETVTPASLAGYRRMGVNRLSFGVQSFRDDELRRLSRLHGVDRARSAYADARAAGFDNVSLDLMMWLPGQKVADWLASVDAAIDLTPDHLSLYLLEIYPNAPLRDEMARAKWSQAPDDDAAEMYSEAMNRLERKGYTQYEISNVAKPGRRSRHNLKYWQDGCWRGFGAGAHSTRDGIRWKNVSTTDDYIARLLADRSGTRLFSEVRRLSSAERLGEALFTGLRLNEGIDLPAARGRYGVDVWERFGPDLQPFVDGGLLERTPQRLRLTPRGMLLAHEVMTVFV
ncbi:MAG: radical SAM family heme chaperone HemW [Acidimicrobiia bacterium]|nr:radical SAM family heme chaperone HemW [Acidimicrobiia bacterium]